MNLVWKLLRQHISIPQFVGFFFANLVGVAIILLGVQFYNDYKALDSEDSFMKADYLIVNKKIGALSGLTGAQSTFSQTDIDNLAAEDFVERMGAFTPSSFNVRARFNVEGFVSFSTEMFFESVPDDFVDVESDAWHYREGSSDIPIILPKNYLDLYNFGYAQGKGLPKLSEGILGAMKLQIQIEGNGGHGDFDGRIVGFSSRLNTILVPEQFMQWANQQYANSDEAKEPTRLIVEVNNPTDERITSYLQAHDYETDEDKLDASKTTYILRIIVSIVMAVGIVISILSIYILMLSVFLLVQKNSTKLENLLLIGYSPTKVSFPYQALTVGLNVLVLLLAVAVMLVVRSIYLEMFQNFFPDLEVPGILPALCVGLVLLVIVSIFNIIAVYGKVMSIWKRKD
ncbi:MAG: ABC transporter permease [Bacteroidaceae bacterium]|nr:ABC transporter permease [Bacteroidaceae bacterium]